jgi:hypothetical protein
MKHVDTVIPILLGTGNFVVDIWFSRVSRIYFYPPILMLRSVVSIHFNISSHIFFYYIYLLFS